MKKLNLLMTLMMISAMVFGQDVSVVFQVDMSNVTVSGDGVSVAGSFQAWTPGAAMMTDGDGDGIYTYTAIVPQNTDIQYKFINGIAWGADEAVPEACGVPNGLGGFNRSVSVGTVDVVVDAVCYAACGSCTPLPDPVQGDLCTDPLTANLGINTTDTLVYPSSPDPANATNAKWFVFTPTTTGNHTIASCMGGIDTRVMVFEGGCDALVMVGNNDDFCEMSEGSDLYASFLVLPMVAGTPYYIVWDDVWDTSGFDWSIEEGGTLVSYTVSVDMANEEVSDEGVWIINNILNEPVIMTNTGESVWEYTMSGLQPGMELVYLFINGVSAWPASGESTIPDDCGLFIPNLGMNVRFVMTPQADSTAETVCFNTCGPCVQTIYRNVTLRVDMEHLVVGGGTVSANGVHVAGSFQSELGLPDDWDASATPLTQVPGTNVWETALIIPEGSYEYKYINGNTWTDPNENLSGDCASVGGFGNRALTISSDTIIEYCFNFCFSCDLVLNSDNAALDKVISISPNPATDAINVAYDLPEVSDLQVRIVNQLGPTVWSQTLRSVQNGGISVDVSNIPTGVYTVNFTNGTLTASKRLVKQ